MSLIKTFKMHKKCTLDIRYDRFRYFFLSKNRNPKFLVAKNFIKKDLVYMFLFT